LAVFAVGLLALSAVLAGSDSSDAASPLRISGYVEFGGEPYDDSKADVIIAEVVDISEPPEPLGSAGKIKYRYTYEEGNKTEHVAKGINGGRFQFEIEREVNPDNAFFFRIKAAEYKLNNLPTGQIFTDPREYTLGTGGDIWYKFDMKKVLEAGNTETVDGKEFHLLSGTSSMGAFSMAIADEYRLSGSVSSGDFKIIGAKVELVRVRDGVPITIAEDYTDKFGKYTLYFKPGLYHLKVSADGYKPQEIEMDLWRESDATKDIENMEADKGTDIPRTLMYIAAATGVLLIVASIIYRVYLKKNPERSILYDDQG